MLLHEEELTRDRDVAGWDWSVSPFSLPGWWGGSHTYAPGCVGTLREPVTLQVWEYRVLRLLKPIIMSGTYVIKL